MIKPDDMKRAIKNMASIGTELRARKEPTDADSETIKEMAAQLWAAGLDLDESDFIAKMLFRNDKRIVSAGVKPSERK